MTIRVGDWIRWDYGDGRSSKWHRVFSVGNGTWRVYCGKGEGKTVLDVWQNDDPEDEHDNCHPCRRAAEVEARVNERMRA